MALRSVAIPLAAALLVAACGSSDRESEPSPDAGSAATTIPTDKGSVEGTVDGSTRVFLGIPFAAPPVGELRWKPPQPHAPWGDVLSATKRGANCAQVGALSSSWDSTTREDCLTLNVWAPAAATSKPAPVMVWLHGGSFVIGSGALPDYDGRKLSEATGAIVVTINYRLGALGFLAQSALRAEDPSYPSSGNYGFEDQRAALAWVKTNIAAFGGDPANVTLFGESAGAISTCLHLFSAKSDGLFQRAIIESGACTAGSRTTETESETQGDAFTKALGCDGQAPGDTLACLRGKSTKQVVEALSTSPFGFVDGGTSWGPVVDGWDLTDTPDHLVASGAFSHVPTLLGTNHDEGTLFFALSSPVTDDASYLALAERLSPGHGADVVAHYPSAAYASAKDAAAVALGDAAFVCPARRLARALSGAGVATYLYQFVHASAGAIVGNIGAFHASEIPFVFGNRTLLLPQSPTDVEAPLVTSMMGYWGRMAMGGDPNGGGALAWPAYDAASDQNVVLDLELSTQAGLKKSDCDFWDSLGP